MDRGEGNGMGDTTRVVAAGVVAGALVLALAGCGSGSGSSSPVSTGMAASSEAADAGEAASGVQTDSAAAETYQGVLDEYTAKLQAATPGLIDEYNAEAAGNADGLQGLAKICNAKVTKLAAISTEGTSEMARLMYRTGSVSTSEYEDWAGRLNDVYTEEAQKIQDAYMASMQ